MRAALPLVLFTAAGCRFHFDPVAGDSIDGDATTAGDVLGDGLVDGTNVTPFTIYIEAESGLVASLFQLQSTGPETYAIDTNLAGETGPGSVSFTVRIFEAGDYYLWARVLTQDSTTDAFNVTFGSHGPFVYDTSECMFSGLWHWTRMRVDGTCVPLSAPRAFALQPGDTTLLVASREGGSRVDKLVVTNLVDLVPQ